MVENREKMVTVVFRDRVNAQNAYESLRECGYMPGEINLLLSDATRSTFLPTKKDHEPIEPGNQAVEGMDPEAAADLATYLIAAGRCDEAEPVLHGLISSGSRRAQNFLNLGYCLQLSGRDEEAVAAFQSVLELDPGSSTAVFNLTVVLTRLGRAEEAASYEAMLRKQMRHDQVEAFLLGGQRAVLRVENLLEMRILQPVLLGEIVAEVVVRLRLKAGEVGRAYEHLAADPLVVAALGQLAGPSRRAPRLAPSAEFAREVARIPEFERALGGDSPPAGRG